MGRCPKAVFEVVICHNQEGEPHIFDVMPLCGPAEYHQAAAEGGGLQGMAGASPACFQVTLSDKALAGLAQAIP